MIPANGFDLERFVKAQAPVWQAVEEELRNGAKRSHWMWFVFPQLKGLGRSEAAQYYGLSSLAHARAYLMHPMLGPRLEASTRLVLGHPSRSAEAIFGSPDDLKFRSSMTLFDAVEPASVFAAALTTFFAGQPDARTLALLDAAGPSAYGAGG